MEENYKGNVFVAIFFLIEIFILIFQPLKVIIQQLFCAMGTNKNNNNVNNNKLEKATQKKCAIITQHNHKRMFNNPFDLAIYMWVHVCEYMCNVKST